MKDELKRIARDNGEQARKKASRVVVMLKVYGTDPERNWIFRIEAEQLARRVVYHMRQAVILGALIERLDAQARRAREAGQQVKQFHRKPSRLR